MWPHSQAAREDARALERRAEGLRMQLGELRGAVEELLFWRGAVALPHYLCWPDNKAGLLEDCMADAYAMQLAQHLRVREGKGGGCWEPRANKPPRQTHTSHVPERSMRPAGTAGWYLPA